MGNFTDIKLVDRKAQTHFYAGGLAILDSSQGGLKGTLDAAKAIVDFLHAVQADADIRQPDIFQGPGHRCGNQRAVG